MILGHTNINKIGVDLIVVSYNVRCPHCYFLSSIVMAFYNGWVHFLNSTTRTKSGDIIIKAIIRGELRSENVSHLLFNVIFYFRNYKLIFQ